MSNNPLSKPTTVSLKELRDVIYDDDAGGGGALANKVIARPEVYLYNPAPSTVKFTLAYDDVFCFDLEHIHLLDENYDEVVGLNLVDLRNTTDTASIVGTQYYSNPILQCNVAPDTLTSQLRVIFGQKDFLYNLPETALITFNSAIQEVDADVQNAIKNLKATAAWDTVLPNLPTTDTLTGLTTRMVAVEEGSGVGPHADTHEDGGSDEVEHNKMASTGSTPLQGGTIAERYHLTNAQYTNLTDSGDTVLHKHDTMYYTEAELDGGQLDNRYRTETELAAVGTTPGAAYIGLRAADFGGILNGAVLLRSALVTLDAHGHPEGDIVFDDSAGHQHTGSSDDGTPLPTAGLEDRAVIRMKAHDGVNLIKNCSGEIGGIAGGTTNYPYWFLHNGLDDTPPLWGARNYEGTNHGPYFYLSQSVPGAGFVQDVSVPYPVRTEGLSLAVGAEGIAVGDAEIYLLVFAYTNAAGTTGVSQIGTFVPFTTSGTYVKNTGIFTIGSGFLSYRIVRRLKNTGATGTTTGYLRNIMVSGGANAEDPTIARIFQLPPPVVADVDDDTIEVSPGGVISRNRVACMYTCDNNAHNILAAAGSALKPFRCDLGTFDLTGTDATITTGAAWKFTANRPMVLWVAANAQTPTYDVGLGDYLRMILYKNTNIYRHMAYDIRENDWALATISVMGGTLIELDTNDYFQIGFTYDVSLATYLNADAQECWISAHEIP